MSGEVCSLGKVSKEAPGIRSGSLKTEYAGTVVGIWYLVNLSLGDAVENVG